MQVQVIKNFYDKTAALKLRKKGELLEVDEVRAAKLIDMKLAEAVVETETETATATTVKKKTTTRKTTATKATK